MWSDHNECSTLVECVMRNDVSEFDADSGQFDEGRANDDDS